MQTFAVLAAVLVMFAGQAFSLSVNISSTMQMIPASQFLNVSEATGVCQSDCAPALSAITTCTDNNDGCLCSDTTVKPITACQQCMFTDLIHNFKVSPDPRVGSSAALTAYATACNASTGITIGTTLVALAPPADWNGPFGQGLNVGGTVVSVIAAAILGVGCIFVVNSM